MCAGCNQRWNWITWMSYSGTAHYVWVIGICALSLEHEPELRDSKVDIWAHMHEEQI